MASRNSIVVRDSSGNIVSIGSMIGVELDDITQKLLDKFDKNAGRDFIAALEPFVPMKTGALRESATFNNVGPGHTVLTYDPVDDRDLHYASFAYGMDPYETNFTTPGTFSPWDDNPFDLDDSFIDRVDRIIGGYIESI